MTKMKTKLAVLLLSLASLALAQPQPSSTVNPSPPTPPSAKPGLQMTEAQRASAVSAQIVTTLNNTFDNLKAILDGGIPAKDGEPALSAEQIKAALGEENIKRIEAARKALNGEKQ